MIYLTIVAFTFFLMYNPKGNYNKPKWMLFSILGCYLLSLSFYYHSNLYLALLFFYILFFAIHHSIYDMHKDQNIYTQAESAKTGIVLFSFGIIFILITKEHISYIYASIPMILTLNTFYKIMPAWIVKKIGHLKECGTPSIGYGIGSNVSVDSTLMSILAAIMLTKEYPYYIKEIALVCTCYNMYYNKATSGLLGFILALFIWFTFSLHVYWLSVVLILASTIILITFRKKLLTDSGRFEIWNFAWTRLINRFNIVKGIGPGCFRVLMPYHQVTEHMKTKTKEKITYTEWMHCDVLQFIIESGLIGLVLAIAVLLSMIPNFTVNEWIIFSAIAINMVFNFPMHLAPDTFLILIFIKKYFLDRVVS